MAATFCGISGYACVVEKLQTAQETALKGTLSNTELNDNGMLCILTELKHIRNYNDTTNYNFESP